MEVVIKFKNAEEAVELLRFFALEKVELVSSLEEDARKPDLLVSLEDDAKQKEETRTRENGGYFAIRSQESAD